MEPKPLQRVPFRRGPERRNREGSDDTPANTPPRTERRTPGMDWSTLFRGIDFTPVEEIISECEVLTLPAGTVLLKPGEANDSVYLLLSGELATLIDSTLSADAGIPIRPGESVGEMSAIDGKPVSALVLAATDSRILQLPADIFWQRLSAIPGVARNLLAALTERMRRSNETMLEAQRKRLALEYLQQELEVARQLQSSMLPLHGPLFPERGDLDVEGLMEPASEIGGDLFDAFFIDDKRLFFCVGDVSGHGIPAALFMARTIGLMRIIAMSTAEPDRLLTRVNDQLSVGNDANIFVTLFCGVLEVDTGRLTYSNGGHLAPLLISAGEVRALPLPKGALVGAIEGMKYKAMETTLAPGTTLVCFTDGVTEATDSAGTEFGEDRLAAMVTTIAPADVGGLLKHIRSSVAAFTDHQPLADDCTLLALHRRRSD